MNEMIFWGEHGKYGPFTKQKNGWPNAGEVIRHYRKQLHMSAEELATQYGKATGTQVTVRWMLKMEQENKVPTDITRRQVLVKLLDIPPVLLGLASLESVTHTPAQRSPIPNMPTVLRQHTPPLDPSMYEQQIRTRWLLSYTGEEAFEDFSSNTLQLEQSEQQSSGAFLRHIRSVLNSHYQLASDIARHQGNFSVAWQYANNAVRVAKEIGINDFIGAALYRRGYINLDWAIFGNNVILGKVNREPDRKKVEAAMNDFEQSLLYAGPQLKGAIWLELSRAQGILNNIVIGLRLADQASEVIGVSNSDVDPLEQILRSGALNGLSEGMYLLGKAASLIVIGRTTTATEILDDLEELKSGKGIVRNQVRRLAYIDILRAESAIGEKNYIEAAVRAMSAFHVLRDINTVERIAGINALYGKLVERYGNHSVAEELGDQLTKYYKRNTTQRKASQESKPL